MFQWEEDEEDTSSNKRPTATKRTRKASVGSDEQDCSSSETIKRARPKRLKQESKQLDYSRTSDLEEKMYDINLTNHTSLDDDHAVPGNRTVLAPPAAGRGLQRSYQPPIADRTAARFNHHGSPYMWADTAHQLQIPHPLGFIPGASSAYAADEMMDVSRTATPLATSFTSAESNEDGIWDPYQMQHGINTFPGKTDHIFQQPPNGHHMVPAYRATHIPEPRFETVPNTPELCPMTGIPFQDMRGGQSESHNAYGTNVLPSNMDMSSYVTEGNGNVGPHGDYHHDGPHFAPNASGMDSGFHTGAQPHGLPLAYGGPDEMTIGPAYHVAAEYSNLQPLSFENGRHPPLAYHDPNRGRHFQAHGFQ